MKKIMRILLVSLLAVLFVGGTAMAYPFNIRPIAGTVAANFATLQTDFNTKGIGFNAYSDQIGAAYFVPTGEGSHATYLFSYTSAVYLDDYEIGVYDYVTGNKLKLWDELTGVLEGQNVSVDWNLGGTTAVSFWNGSSFITVDTEVGFGPVFGFYLTSEYGTKYSDDLLNGGLAQMLVFDGASISSPNYIYVAMEGATNNGNYTSGNIDFDDFVIKVESIKPVPEPVTLLLLGLGLVGIAGVRRKLK